MRHLTQRNPSCPKQTRASCVGLVDECVTGHIHTIEASSSSRSAPAPFVESGSPVLLFVAGPGEREPNRAGNPLPPLFCLWAPRWAFCYSSVCFFFFRVVSVVCSLSSAAALGMCFFDGSYGVVRFGSGQRRIVLRVTLTRASVMCQVLSDLVFR